MTKFAEILDFAVTSLHWPELLTKCLRKILEAYPSAVFKEKEGDKVGPVA